MRLGDICCRQPGIYMKQESGPHLCCNVWQYGYVQNGHSPNGPFVRTLQHCLGGNNRGCYSRAYAMSWAYCWVLVHNRTTLRYSIFCSKSVLICPLTANMSVSYLPFCLNYSLVIRSTNSHQFVDFLHHSQIEPRSHGYRSNVFTSYYEHKESPSILSFHHK